MQRSGVRFKPEVREAKAREAYRLAEPLAKTGMSAYGQSVEIAIELDISEPTARNLIAFGRRLSEGRG